MRGQTAVAVGLGDIVRAPYEFVHKSGAIVRRGTQGIVEGMGSYRYGSPSLIIAWEILGNETLTLEVALSQVELVA